MLGAIHRAQNAIQSATDAFDFGVGLEGGVTDGAHGLFMCNYVAIASRDGRLGIGGGVKAQLPEVIAKELRNGRELGDVIDEWRGATGIRHGEGTIGILTHGHITRSEMFCDALLCALIPFMDEVVTTASSTISE